MDGLTRSEASGTERVPNSELSVIRKTEPYPQNGAYSLPHDPARRYFPGGTAQRVTALPSAAVGGGRKFRCQRNLPPGPRWSATCDKGAVVLTH